MSLIKLDSLSDPLHAIGRNHFSAICFSNVAACFNFLIYYHLAATISEAFFPPNSNVLIAKLQVLSVFSAGFLARPIGALLIGHYGDTHGRKPAHALCLIALIISAMLTACLPTYAQVGFIAPVLFVLVRLIQGMMFGAYAPLGWVFVCEHVPKSKIASYCSFVTASLLAGSFSSYLFATILRDTFSHSYMVADGWRIPFIVGGIISLIALFFSRTIQETPSFIHAKSIDGVDDDGSAKKASFINHPKAVLLTAFLSMINASLVIVVTLILPMLIGLVYTIDSAFLSFGNMLGLLFMIVGCIFYGITADRYNINKVFMLGGLILILSTLAFYWHLESRQGDYVLFMYALLGFSGGIISLCPTIFVTLFATQIRLTAVSVSYNLVYAFVGAILPFSLVFLTQSYSLSPAIYLIGIGLATLAIGFYLSKSAIVNQYYSSDYTNID